MTIPRIHGYNQLATYWAKQSANEYGEEIYDAPVLMNVRWEDSEALRMAPTQQDVTFKTVVFVPQDVTEESYLAQGDQTALADPLLATAYKIKAIIKTPSLRTNTSEIRAFL